MLMTDKEVYKKTLELFGSVCALCGNNRIELHHIRHGAEGRKTYLGNVIPLCSDCHRKTHNNTRIYTPILLELVEMRLNSGLSYALYNQLSTGNEEKSPKNN